MYLTVFREEATSVLADKHLININICGGEKNKQPEKTPGAGQEPTANSTHKHCMPLGWNYIWATLEGDKHPHRLAIPASLT